jgi:hypothetical protein
VSAPFRRRRDGRVTVRLDPEVRSVLVTLADQLHPVLDGGEPMARRLFPPAYPGADQLREEEAYRQLVDGALVSHHREAFTVLAETAQATTLTSAEFDAWLSSVESMRLVLGTGLDVSEEMEEPDTDDPTAPEYALYELLGQLQFLMIEVLAADLPDEGRPEGIL